MSDDRRELDQLYSAVYTELRRLASAIRRKRPDLPISPTTLVHEAWMKVARTPEIAATEPDHFKRIVGRAMRQVLVDEVRARYADKRGGRDAVFVTLDETIATNCTPEQLLRVTSTLEELERMNPRLAAMVEYRFFAGLSIAETASLLNVSEATVERDWRAVKAWLEIALEITI